MMIDPLRLSPTTSSLTVGILEEPRTDTGERVSIDEAGRSPCHYYGPEPEVPPGSD
jgi:hypothetical protein